jgi:N-acetylneuraminic acid mutarotase
MERRLLISVAILLFITGMWIKPGFAQDGTWDVPIWLEDGRWGLSAVEVRGQIFLTGGINGDWFGTSTKEVLVYDVETNTFLKAADLPAGRNGHGSCYIRGSVYVFGGKEGANTEATNTVYSVRPTNLSNEWTAHNNMPISVCDFGLATYDNRVYIFGGSKKMFGVAPYNSTFMYNPATDTWEQKADMPTARSGLGAVVMDDKIYCIGGVASYDGGSGDNSDQIWYDIVEIYDPATDTWSTGAPMSTFHAWYGLVGLKGLIYAVNSYYSWNVNEAYNPFEDEWTTISKCNHQRGYATACAMGDSVIYAFGGISNDNIDRVVQVEKFKPHETQEKRGLWTTIAEIDTARCMVPAVSHEGKIYLPGGFCQASGRCLDKVSVFDPATTSFDVLPPLPQARNGHGAAFLDGHLYVFGGKTAFSSGAAQKQVWMFDPDSSKWIAKAPMPANCHFGCAILDDKAYIVGGAKSYIGNRLKSLYVYDPKTDSWEQKANMQFARVEVCAVAFEGKIWALGGFTDEVEGVKIVEIYDPQTDTWQRGKDLRYGHTAGSASVVDGKIYMTGGWKGQEFIEVFDPKMNVWNPVKRMHQSRAYHTTCTVNGKMYALGGLRSGSAPYYVLGIEEFDPLAVDTDVHTYPKEKVVAHFGLKQNYPNPFNPSTTITYNVAQPGKVKLTVYNALGQGVAELVNDFQVEGSHSVTFDASHLSTGIYFYQLQVEGRFSEKKKMLLLK